MAIILNHVVVHGADNVAAARAFADVMGLRLGPPEGIDGKFATVPVNESLKLFFVTAESTAPQHLDFEVDATTFDAILSRLRARGIPFGNDPRDPANGRTDHPFAAQGCFWHHGNGPLFEVTVGAARS